MNLGVSGECVFLEGKKTFCESKIIFGKNRTKDFVYFWRIILCFLKKK